MSPGYDFAKRDNSPPKERLKELVFKLREHAHTFVLYPTLWSRWNHSPNLIWSIVKFEKGAQGLVPEQRGLYVFIVVPQTPSCIPAIGFPIYVGETGDQSKAHLRKRFDQYLREANGSGRLKLYVTMQQLKGHTFFAFAPVLDKSISLKSLESDLTDALVPPLADQDYSAEMRKAVAAL